MFVTEAIFTSEIGKFANTETTQYWSAVELAFDHAWFLMKFHQFDPMDGSTCHRTMMIDCITDAVQLAEQDDASGPIQLDSVYVITLGSANNSKQWRMDRVKALWVAEHPDKNSKQIEICEIVTGEKFVTSLFGAPIADLKEQTLKCKFFD
jgi:hypothetical protein